MRKIIATATVLIAVIFIPVAQSHNVNSKSNKNVICKVFGSYCGQALRVTWCESRWNTWAQNGQYQGLFQMGSWERRTYGHSTTAYGQARAAYKYFVASGRDWSPWSCKP